jgi:arsenate reductase
MKNNIIVKGALVLVFIFSLSNIEAQKANLNPKLLKYCSSIESEFNQITDDRKEYLNELVSYIAEQQKAQKAINLVFVCTSNSRRSHMAQVWSQVASCYYDVNKVSTFSGGTEKTKVNKNALSALKKTGIVLQSNQQSENPIWLASIGAKYTPMVLFSKVYTDSTNPSQNFGAVMVCAEANESCPIVPGADFRLGLPYQDPKAFDNTPQQNEKYDERCRQIAREMFYVFSQIK